MRVDVQRGIRILKTKWNDVCQATDEGRGTQIVQRGLRALVLVVRRGHIRGYDRQLAGLKQVYDVVEVADFIRPGMTEKQVAAFMRDEVERRSLTPAWDAATCPSVFSGPETAEAHYQPTERRVERGHILNMDFGVRVDGYCSDMQRTFYAMAEGETAVPEDVQKGFDTIVEAVEMSRQAIAPGKIGLDIDALAREIVTAAGYDEFPHALGHQVGRYAHDGTALLGPAWEKYAQKPLQKLEPNMVFTLEPRLTVPGRGVATIEEMILVTETGAEYLSTPQKDLLLIQ